MSERVRSFLKQKSTQAANKYSLTGREHERKRPITLPKLTCLEEDDGDDLETAR